MIGEIDPWMTKASKILISFHSLKTKAKAQLELKWMTKASKILISFHSLKTKAKAQLELISFGSYQMILIQAVLLL